MTHYGRNQEILQIVKEKITSDKARNMKIVFKDLAIGERPEYSVTKLCRNKGAGGILKVGDGVSQVICYCKLVLPEGKGNNFFHIFRTEVVLQLGARCLQRFGYSSTTETGTLGTLPSLMTVLSRKLPQCLRNSVKVTKLPRQLWKD